MDRLVARESLTDAIRYWEPRRIFYNLALAVIVIFYFVRTLPASKAAVSLDSILVLFLLVVLANVAYSAAYVVDVFVQASGFREHWRTLRWCLFTIGLIVAAILTRFFAMGAFVSR